MKSNELKCPVFYPTDADMKMGWEAYIKKIEKKLRVAGVGKIVPPRSWVPRKDNYKGIDYVIEKPIRHAARGGQQTSFFLWHCRIGAYGTVAVFC